MKQLLYLLSLFALVSMSSCNTQMASVFEGKKDFPDQQWLYDSTAVFDFKVEDPNKLYQISYTLRHSLAYRSCNIFINYQLKNEEGRTLRAKLVESELMNCKTGKPLGKGVGEFYDIEQVLLSNYQFEEAGNYSLHLKHYMRTDTLSHVVAVGAKIDDNSSR